MTGVEDQQTEVPASTEGNKGGLDRTSELIKSKEKSKERLQQLTIHKAAERAPSQLDVNRCISMASTSDGDSKAKVGRQLSLIDRLKDENGTYRTVLPVNQPPLDKITLMYLVRLVRDGLPMSYFEPLDTMQRLCNSLEHSSLLDKAVAAVGSEMEKRQMMFVLSFAVSQYAGTFRRLGKPFNPILGGTYSMDRWNDRGWRFYAEQVGHSPDISAFHAIGKSGWTVTSSMLFRLTFSMTGGVQFSPVGQTEVTIGDTTYTYNPVNSYVYHVTNPEKRAVAHVGTITVKSSTNAKLTATATFTGEKSMKGQVSIGGKEVITMEGQWMESLKADDDTVLYTVEPALADETVQFGFGKFARELNQILDKRMAKALPPTDSRFRPDQRLFEEGKYETAAKEKKNLEIQQRRRRKAEMKDWSPLWFENFAPSSPSSASSPSSTSKPTNHSNWKPNHKFWPAYNSQFTGVTFPDIFS